MTLTNKDKRVGNKIKYTAIRKVIQRTIKENCFVTIFLVVTLIGSVILSLIPPLVLEKIVNMLSLQKNIALSLALSYLGVVIISGLFDSAKELLITIFGQKITHGLRSEMCSKLSLLPASYYTSNSPGSITSRFVNDVDTVEELFADGIISMFVDICKVVSIIGVIFVKSMGLGLIITIVAPVLFLITRKFQKRMLVAEKANRVAIAEVNQFLPETIGNIRTIHCLLKEKYMEKQYDKKITACYHAVDKTNLYDSLYSPIINIMSAVVIAILMVFAAMGGTMQSFFGMSVGTAVAVIAYVSKVFSPLEDIGMEIQSIQSAVAGVNRINELFNETEEENHDDTITIDKLIKNSQSGIGLENVTFSYTSGESVVENLSFNISKGEMVTLAGRTGAGKSTIFKLLLGLYKPQKGVVTIFGADASKIPHSEKRKLFGYVEQSFHMVPGTVKDQISLYDNEISDKDIRKAAQLVGMDDCILKLSHGYNTDCSSVSFSQGQLQLLSIARAVVKNPPIMLLDEITANLDSITERQVMVALEHASNGRTVVSISHRLYENLGTKIIKI